MSVWLEKQTHRFPRAVFTVDRRYTPKKVIGLGAYGVVCVAQDELTAKEVAIKKILDVWSHPTIARRTLREIKLMKHFAAHENILSILTVLSVPPNPGEREEVYVVSELLGGDLHRIIHSQQQLTEEHATYFLYQLLRGLKFIHTANVIHRDIKPSNLLVTADCDLKICDFGLARIADPNYNHAGLLTEYVATRWYRAPEIMLNAKAYTMAIDVWSAGCIIAEMMGERALFPGKNYLHQLVLILGVIGTPEPHELDCISNEKARQYVRSLPQQARVDFATLFPTTDPNGLELVERLLTFNPSNRITVEDALAMPFFEQYYDPDDEPIAEHPFQLEMELDDLPKQTLKQMIFEEAQKFEGRKM
eukprot:m.523567 g.523567  ORF g.523567 m.523567 type:complete len:362 (+) comp57525_c0_seq1:225-1310(+)